MPTQALKPAAGAELFAARALDFESVRAVLERHASTSLGLRALRGLGPRRYDDAKAALARTREMIELERARQQPNLMGVCDPLPALQHARTAGRPIEDAAFVQIAGFLEAAERLAEWLCALQGAPALAELGRRVPEYDELAERLAATIDEQGRVRENASPALSRLRREEAEVAANLDRSLRQILARPEVRTVLADPNPMRRGGRPVLAVKAKSAARVQGIVHDRSQTGETVFIEPREVVALGNRHAELVSDERREVERVLAELTRELLRQEPAIERGAEALGELELALVGARWALETRGRVALQPGQAGAAPGLLLRNARHPLLLEQQRLGKLAEVVPIDLRLSGDFDVLIITGPNTGGKTLALKTAGLFALCTRAGLPFPCEQGSTAPLFDGIVADIGDEQEISQSLSTFSSHLKRIREGLERATNATLVLLDELGSGTDPDEGAALGEALLEVLLKRKCPTLVSTHIGKLKEFAFRHPRAENACVEFDAATLSPRYHLIVGMPGESGALVIARRLGLPPEIVERAKQRLVRRDEELTQLMADMRDARTQAEKARGAAESRLEDAERMREEAVEQKRALEQKSELLEAEAQQSIEERVRNAAKVLERARALVEQLPAAQRKPMGDTLGELEAELSGSALSARRAEFLAALKKGSFVYVPRYKQRLAVQKVDRAEREVTVQLGSMRMRVSFDEISAWEGR